MIFILPVKLYIKIKKNYIMDQYEDLKYFTTIDKVLDKINEYGVAIIPSILDDNECIDMYNGIWSYFEQITQKWEIPMNRDNKESWSQIYNLFPLHSMLIQYFSIGHAQVSWDMRQNEKIIEVFENIYKIKKEDLLVSFDGLSFSVPFEVTKRGYNRNNTWYHTDQSYLDSNFKCIQSFVTALDVNNGDATLAFMEGSNNFHKDFAIKYDIKNKDDWYKLTKEEENFYLEKGCEYKKIKCPKGSLVLWDSRTIHCGAEPLKERLLPNFRAIIYLCYMPRKLCDAKNLKKKQKAFNEQRTTSHWPSKIKLFPKNPRTYGKKLLEIEKIDPPNLNSIGKKLAGF